MKILLCQSYFGEKIYEPVVFPLGLSYIASMVKDKHEVYCFDPNVTENPMKVLFDLINKINPDVIGVSLRNIDSTFSFYKRSYYAPFISLIRNIRAVSPYCKLIVGGAGFSIFAKEIMRRNPEIDLGVVSEGELTFAELIKDIDHPERVKNVIVRKGNNLFFTGKRAWTDFDSLPFPSRELFDLKKYKHRSYSIGVQTKRGCSFNCMFCPNWFISGTSCLCRSPKKVVDEIEFSTNELGLNSFFFTDSIFNFPAHHSRAICKELIKRKLDIEWSAEFNPEFINSSFMEEAHKSGCNLFNFSPDGASNNALKSLGKSFTMKDIENSIALAKQIKSANFGYSFLYDLPYYNHEHVVGLTKLVPKIMATINTRLSYISFTKIRIFPYTLIYKIALKEKKIDKNTDLLYPVHYENSFSDFLPNLIQTFAYAFHTVTKACRFIGKKT